MSLEQIHKFLAIALDPRGNEGEATNALRLVRRHMLDLGLKSTADLIDFGRKKQTPDTRTFKTNCLSDIPLAWTFSLISALHETARKKNITIFLQIVGQGGAADFADIVLEFTGTPAACQVFMADIKANLGYIRKDQQKVPRKFS